MRGYRFSAAVALLALSAVLGGCGEPGRPSITFMYWSDMSYNRAALTRALAQFRKDHKDIDVSASYTPYGAAYYQKLIIMFGAQSAPDVFFITDPQFTQYASRGGMQDLTGRLVSSHLVLDRSKLASFTLGGKVYAVPRGGIGYSISKASAHPDAAWDLIKDLVIAGYPLR